MSKAWPTRGLDPAKSLDENARKILRVRIAEFYSWAPVVDEENAIAELHALRISAKRLRYTIEMFQPPFGEKAKANLERIRTIQEALGNLHDTDVRIALISDELVVQAREQEEKLQTVLAANPENAAEVTINAAKRRTVNAQRGLLKILAREHQLRRDQFAKFASLWRRYADEDMRTQLLSMTRRPDVASSEEKPGQIISIANSSRRNRTANDKPGTA